MRLHVPRGDDQQLYDLVVQACIEAEFVDDLTVLVLGLLTKSLLTLVPAVPDRPHQQCWWDAHLPPLALSP